MPFTNSTKINLGWFRLPIHQHIVFLTQIVEVLEDAIIDHGLPIVQYHLSTTSIRKVTFLDIPHPMPHRNRVQDLAHVVRHDAEEWNVLP